MADISRRTLLNRALLVSALGSGALLGLTRPLKHKLATPPPPPPAALTAALNRQGRLLAGYDQALATQPAHPELAGLRADVAAHGNALRAVLQRYPGWRLAATAAASGGRTPDGSSAPSDSTTPDASATAGNPSSGATLASLAAASSAAAAATTRACLGWPATEPHAAEVVPLLGSIAACLTSHAQVLR